ncbi:O-antigen ligase family protein [Peptococcaceae bacterium]|nr:O-antigen ligase family protein [Peptococcaceae bacterium]
MINNNTERQEKWYHRLAGANGSNLSYALLWLMIAIYPLLVIPNNVTYEFILLHPFMPETINLVPSYFYAPRYVLLAALAMLALVLLLVVKLSPGQQQRRWERVPLALFLFFGCVATVMAASPQTAWFGTPMRWTGFTTDLFCVILFLLAWHTLNLPRIEKLLCWMSGAAAVVAVLAVLQYYGLNLVPHEEFRANFIAYGTMANPNFLGTYMVFTLPAAILIFLYRRRTWPWLLCSALIYAGLLVSLTRGVWLTGLLVYLVICACVFFWSKKEKNLPDNLAAETTAPGECTLKECAGGKKGISGRLNCRLSGLSAKKALVLLSIVFIIVTAVLVPARDGRLLGKAATMPGEMTAAVQLDQQAGSQRMFIWQETVRVWLSDPSITMFGLGPDHLIYMRIITPGESLVDKAHNIYLERAVTQGAGALLAYLVFLAAVLYRLSRCGKGTGLILTAVIGAYLIQGLFNIEVIMTMPLFWIVLGMAMACKDQEQYGNQNIAVQPAPVSNEVCCEKTV